MLTENTNNNTNCQHDKRPVQMKVISSALAKALNKIYSNLSSQINTHKEYNQPDIVLLTTDLEGYLCVLVFFLKKREKPYTLTLRTNKAIKKFLSFQLYLRVII